MTTLSDKALTTILREAQSIAVVGHSPKPQRPSYQIAQYLRSAGYQIYPIHPAVKEIDSQQVFATLAELPGPVDIINIFRRAEALPGIVQEVIDLQATLKDRWGHTPMIWAQLGVAHPEADALATTMGLRFVSDRCIKIEHQRLLR